MLMDRKHFGRTASSAFDGLTETDRRIERLFWRLVNEVPDDSPRYIEGYKRRCAHCGQQFETAYKGFGYCSAWCLRRARAESTMTTAAPPKKRVSPRPREAKLLQERTEPNNNGGSNG